ncbi:hypothetical protein JDV02_000427 [Purpureocillium takamizusanense]|uniref:Uncharacterized protein n=1 Tax=Purpureocillium takamizusanense TaxID=2060973 RepID=A0A9Q8Q7C8_9HYPO|nr:uncharacterized protein JDV02_000427 [Purpureocillium takamizusanense]UNI13708.1 hypothetical protein JDV02_000427 [Purpureocillium takamizusanense]
MTKSELRATHCRARAVERMSSKRRLARGSTPLGEPLNRTDGKEFLDAMHTLLRALAENMAANLFKVAKTEEEGELRSGRARSTKPDAQEVRGGDDDALPTH